jgi:molybdate transport system substrate-binding protein
MKHAVYLSALLCLLALGATAAPVWCAAKPLLVLAPDSIQCALDAAAQVYQQTTGVPVKVTYCKQKQAFALAKEQKGDVFFSAHADGFENAAKEGLVRDDTPRPIIGYLQIVLAVPKGNPRKIATLSDLGRPGVKVGLGDPATAQLGQVSEALLEKAGLAEAVHANVVARGDCCSKVRALLVDGKVEAALGWAAFAKAEPKKIEAIPLPADLAQPLPVVGLVLTTSEHPKEAARFIAFLQTRKGKAIFTKFGYYPRLTPARAAP